MKPASTLTFFLLAAVSGCADLHYDRLHLGGSSADYDRVLPEEHLRRTDVGHCYFESNALGRSDAIVLLLGRDRRAYAKMHATLDVHSADLVTRKPSYTLKGEIDPVVGGMKGTGPLDVLRAIHGDLLHDLGDAVSADARRYVAAGLQRVLERWPHADETPSDAAALEETLRQIHGGGRATISISPDGRVLVEYVEGAAR